MIGVLSVIDLAEPDAMGPTGHPLAAASIAELLPFLVVLADLAALAFENSDILRIQERRTQFIKLLHTIATIPASESIEALAHTTHRSALCDHAGRGRQHHAAQRDDGRADRA